MHEAITSAALVGAACAFAAGQAATGLPITYREPCALPTTAHADYPDLRPSRTPPSRHETAQNGGSARGYQGLPAPLAIPATATETAARLYFYASPALA